ncbi:2-oxoglutarate (2OG) and Fe(II)-dependent oxygenase superfamily protein [Actinidia rufa]|uniref:2-oxoglutarate (2OG) and Fe(II)-dependent oxygenase superfamily protein n=1 Tax=Actinidia rufa TaxID=165716 RepID=A0A7J0FFY0_9ERIC|nr:2-oxoglutarate (2OG) and Fe(II)-dependent oxygenase superfamily protein [Actinidia rufa]
MVIQNMGMGGCIPVIDMKDFAGQSEKLMEACRELGCFRIINHNIPESLMMEMKVVSRSLLDLPVEVKLRNSDPVEGKGYTSPHKASAVFEGLGCYDMTAPGALDNFFHQLGACPQQREIISKYSKAIHELGVDLGRKVLKGLGLSGDLFDGWPCQLRLNKYNYTSQFIGLTGAWIRRREYIPVDPMPGSLVVNLGDLAVLWSNGRLSSVKHRVQCYEGTERVSVAMFVLGPKDRAVAAPNELVDSEHPRLFNSVKFDDYRMLRITTSSPTGGALELLRIKS